jgi:hypothetical protein
MKQKFTTVEIAEAIAASFSYTEALRKLGRYVRTGTITDLNLRCRREGIDVSHFTGSNHNKGQRSNKRKLPDAVFVVGKNGDRRVLASVLRRALFEAGVKHICNDCGMDPEWNGKQLVLQVDHIDGQYWNNIRENLQFLCPNCHSQTATYGSKVRE